MQKHGLSVGRGALSDVGCSSVSQEGGGWSWSVSVSVPLLPSEASCTQVCVTRSEGSEPTPRAVLASLY